MSEDIFAVNLEEDIAITLTDDGITDNFDGEQLPFRECLVLLSGENEGWGWFITGEIEPDIEGIFGDGDWEFDEERTGFKNYMAAAKDALKYIRSHGNASQWQRGIKTIEKLLADPSLDPRGLSKR